MRSRFEYTCSFLDMAESLYEGIQQLGEAASPSTLLYELEFATCIYHHHRGVLGLHTNNPTAALVDFGTCAKVLRVFLRDESERSNLLLGVVLNELGNAYLQLWKLPEAINSLNESVTILQGLNNTTKNLTTMPQINLAFAYWVDGNLNEASSLFVQTLKDRFKELGVEDTSSFT